MKTLPQRTSRPDDQRTHQPTMRDVGKLPQVVGGVQMAKVTSNCVLKRERGQTSIQRRRALAGIVAQTLGDQPTACVIDPRLRTQLAGADVVWHGSAMLATAAET